LAQRDSLILSGNPQLQLRTISYGLYSYEYAGPGRADATRSLPWVRHAPQHQDLAAPRELQTIYVSLGGLHHHYARV